MPSDKGIFTDLTKDLAELAKNSRALTAQNAALVRRVEKLETEGKRFKSDIHALKKNQSEKSLVAAVDRVAKAVRESKGDMTLEEENEALEGVKDLSNTATMTKGPDELSTALESNETGKPVGKE